MAITSEFIPLTFEFIGTVLIGLAILSVHSRMEVEHKIDRKVVKAIRQEQLLTKIGLVLISIGFIWHIVFLLKI